MVVVVATGSREPDDRTVVVVAAAVVAAGRPSVGSDGDVGADAADSRSQQRPPD